MPASLRYEPEQIVAESDYVLVHGRFGQELLHLTSPGLSSKFFLGF
jgi:hypothetical protein